jgi:hypothetical protein
MKNVEPPPTAVSFAGGTPALHFPIKLKILFFTGSYRLLFGMTKNRFCNSFEEISLSPRRGERAGVRGE